MWLEKVFWLGMKIEPYFIVIFVINGNSSVNYPIGLHTDVLKNVLYIYTL